MQLWLIRRVRLGQVGDQQDYRGEYTDRQERDTAEARESTVMNEETRHCDRETAHIRAHDLDRERKARTAIVSCQPGAHQICEGRVEYPFPHFIGE